MILRQATLDDRALIRHIAIPTWKVTYGDILTDEQFAYMIEKMYSDDSIDQQMQSGHEFFIAYNDDEAPVGFMSLHSKDTDFYILEKLYVLPHAQGIGLGRFLIEQAEEYIRRRHPNQQVMLELNVNRNNRAVEFYKRLGFNIDRLVDEYIGDGFYKNDYIMQKTVYC